MKQKGIYGKAALTAILTVCAILIFYDTFFGSRTLIALLKKLLDALTPILLGSLFAYLLAPVINFFDHLLFPAAAERDEWKATIAEQIENERHRVEKADREMADLSKKKAKITLSLLKNGPSANPTQRCPPRLTPRPLPPARHLRRKPLALREGAVGRDPHAPKHPVVMHHPLFQFTVLHVAVSALFNGFSRKRHSRTWF